MKVLVFDLEMNQPSNTIIQVGACVGDLGTGQIVESLCDDVYAPEILSDFIVKLTGITQEDVRNGQDLPLVYDAFVDMYERHECDRQLVVWGSGDVTTLKNQIPESSKWPYSRRWLDVKTIYQAYCLANGWKMEGGLKKACNRLGVNFEGNAHNALVDAQNTFKLYYELLNRLKNV